MPELPDLQAFSVNLQKQLKGRRLSGITIAKRADANKSAAAIKKQLVGRKLKTVYREGKELRFEFDKDILLGMHLMLHGKLMWEEEKKPAYVLAEFRFDGKPALWLTDFHYKAKISLDPVPAESPDVLDKKVNAKFWKEQLSSKKAIKTVLMDQKVVRGIGNAYADEILWEAGISPFSVAEKVPATKITALQKAVRKVFTNAGKQILKKEPGIIGGEVRDFLKIHNSKVKESPTGGKIKQKPLGGRKTYYTDEQEQFG